MTMADFGNVLPEQDYSSLSIQRAINTYHAIFECSFCEFIELRNLEENETGYSEIIVIDILSDGVPKKCQIGIQYRERLALRFFTDENTLPEIRALRANFPDTFHQNHVPENTPASLCIYLEAWSSVSRSWTPQKHLRNILSWLERIANDELHADDQPLEPFFFENGLFRMIMPVDFAEKVGNNDFVLVTETRAANDTKKVTLTLAGFFIPFQQAQNRTDVRLHTIHIHTSNIVHGLIERIPCTFGQLHDQFEARGVNLALLVHNEIMRCAEGAGILKSKQDYTLITLSIPLVAEEGGDIERVQLKGFCLHENITSIGEKAGILHLNEDKYWYTPHALGDPGFQLDDWRNITLEPIELLTPFTKDVARKASGINNEGPDGVLAGLGALGSMLHNIWTREGWGDWSLIDIDVLNPHNLARHTAFESQLGVFKVEAAHGIKQSIYPHEDGGTIIAGSVDEFTNEAVINALSESELIIDITTTLNVPRSLAVRNDIARSVSGFISPTGLAAVLLIEDSDRTIRLDVLETQYYRAIINKDWGREHLTGHNGKMWVGAGCRDISSIIPIDLIQLHASILARHIRIKTAVPESSINVWHCNESTGEVSVESLVPLESESIKIDEYTLVWDEHTIDKVHSLRQDKLPNETGGILLGYYDQVLSKVFIVDAMSAPSDSEEQATGFIRGSEDLTEVINDAMERTANIVGYIGEWHSHPDSVSTNPSQDDIHLLTHLATQLNLDGLPALMLIVGDDDNHTWLMGEVRI